ncbi:MAG: CCA tRNA nucleotidyltransferase [Bacteroidia bacterium]
MNLQSALQGEVFEKLQQAASQLNVRAYLIGGFVRDHLLQRPCKDIDVVVEGQGIALAQAFGKAVKAKEVIIYENFGTALVRYRDYDVEFVGARKESYQRDSRKPFVEEGSLEEDQLRRDFTINALSISLNQSDLGEVFDPFDGLQDLKDGIIRTPTDPNVTFSDDPLRMLRAIRFATQLGFLIEERTYEAISKNKARIKIISQERIKDELNKMIMAAPNKAPSLGLEILFKTGLLEIILPELAAMQGIELVNGRGHKDNFYHTLQVLDNVAEISDQLWLRWVAILHDIAKPVCKRYSPQSGWTFHGHEDKGARMVSKIFKRLKLPLNQDMKYVEKLVRLHQRPIALVNEEVSDSAIRRIVVDAGEDLDDLLDFCRCDITSRNPKKVQRFLRNYQVLEDRIREVEERDNLRNWQPPIDGKTIMDTFDLKPSKTVGLIKNAIREAILEGEIPNDPKAATAFMHKIAPDYLNS